LELHEKTISWRKVAKYPFIGENKKVFELHEFTIDNIVKDYENVINYAIDNLRLILGNIENFVRKRFDDARRECLSYPIQNGIVAYINDKWFTNRYAEAYAKRTRKYLDDDAQSSKKAKHLHIKDSELEILKEWEIGVDKVVKDKRTSYRLNVFDFITLAPKIRSEDMKSKLLLKRFQLVHSSLVNGYVEDLTRSDISVLFTAALHHKVNETVKELLEFFEESKLPKKLIDAADDLKTEINEFKKGKQIGEFYSGAVYNDAFPSCINNAYVDLLAGKNLEHQERLVFVFFCLNIGMSNEELINLFAHSPDFRQDLTGYMLGHAERKKYISYGCKKIKSFGLCKINYNNDIYKWCSDGKINIPLAFFKRMSWMLEKLIIPNLLCFPFLLAQKEPLKKPRNLAPGKKPFTKKQVFTYIKRTSKLKRKKK